MAKQKPRPWVVPVDAHKDGRGRPRTGPRGLAVRELPRLTLRAQGATCATWEALQGVTERPAHALLADVLRVYLAELPEAEAGAVRKAAKRIRREKFNETP